MKVIEEITYVCPLCKTNYSTNIEAKKCLDKGFSPTCKVGDVVFAKSGYSWFDDDVKWVSNPNVKRIADHGNCFGECCTMQFYYVITKIDMESGSSHRPRYHLFTKAMTGKDGNVGHRCGFVFGTHFPPQVIKKPPRYVEEDSRKLLGKAAEWLL